MLNGYAPEYVSVVELRNAEATYSNIIMQLKKLEKKVNRGDIVYIHLSGHGQPYEDLDGDEPDGWDEAFVPYDAHLYYEAGKYTGEKHLTDDILHQYYESLRSKLGTQGVLIVVIDACHSGESYRGDEEKGIFCLIDDEIIDECIIDSALTEIDEYDIFERGTSLGFSKNQKVYIVKKNSSKNRIIIKKQASLSSVLLLESCLSSQKSTELDIHIKDKKGCYRHYFCGPLSYCVYKNICKMKSLSTNMEWVNSLQSIFTKVMCGRGRQQMVIEYTE